MEMRKQGISTNRGDFFGPKYQTKWLTQKNLYFESGQLKATRWFNGDDKLEGEVLIYYENGKLSHKWNFVNGLQTGEKQETYRENGTLLAVEDWESNVKDGKATYYFETGELGQEGQYKNGKKAGEWKTYYSSGKLYKIGRYEHGLETGIWKTFNEDSSPKTTVTYENGGITNIIEH
jgi:antitoxin component YwqK of YwqJK toxin-antitoxin module